MTVFFTFFKFYLRLVRIFYFLFFFTYKLLSYLDNEMGDRMPVYVMALALWNELPVDI